MVILLFLFMNFWLRKIDQPFFTNHLNKFDLNSSISLIMIYYGLILANSFENLLLNIFILIFLMLINLQFIYLGIKMLLFYAAYGLFKKSKHPRIW